MDLSAQLARSTSHFMQMKEPRWGRDVIEDNFVRGTQWERQHETLEEVDRSGEGLRRGIKEWMIAILESPSLSICKLRTWEHL